jgi:type I restriction enzyme S subunit
MKDWKTSILGDLTTFLSRGKSPVYSNDNDGNAVPVLNQACVQNGKLDLARLKFVTRSFWASLPVERRLQSGDVLINSTGTGTLGRLGFWKGEFEAAFDGHITVLRFPDEHCSLFFYHLLSTEGCRSIVENDCTSGSTNQVELLREQLRRVVLKYPPHKDTQLTIANLLSLADHAIEQTEGLIAKQQRIKTGLMHDLLTRGLDAQGRLRDPATHPFKRSVIGAIPKEWRIRQLADIVPPQRPIVYGILMPGEYVERGVPVIKVRDIQNGVIVTEGLFRTHQKIDAAFARSRLRTGDLLFTIRGSVGRMAVVPPELDRANITQDTARITVSEGNTSFVLHCLKMPSQRSIIELHTVGQAVKGINLGEVRKIPIQFPGPNEQAEIARRLDAHDRDIVAIECQLRKLQHLRLGLMHDILTGLVPVAPLLAN